MQPMLTVSRLKKHFPIRNALGAVAARVQAVDGVDFAIAKGETLGVVGEDFAIAKGETLGVVGESGCGKSTTARLLMHLIEPDAGELVLDGDVVGHGGVSVRELRQQVQMVFQDSYSSLNPRHTAAAEIAFGLRTNGRGRAEALEVARQTLRLVGLDPEVFAGRYPHELSGGQRQRVNIARGVALNPRLLILDEAVSALDKSVQAQVLNLLGELKRRLNLTYLFISHDLDVVHYISDRVMVMYLGRVVEIGPVETLWERPGHPYTRALFSSRLSHDPGDRVSAAPLTGDPPNPINPPSGCRFRTRCAIAEACCAGLDPRLLPMDGAGAHAVACLAVQPGSGHSLAAGQAYAA